MIACAACAAAAERIAVITEGIRASISPFIRARELDALRARGLRVEENPVRPGERVPVLFRRDVDLLIHRLRELDLSRAERVQVKVSSEKTGEVMMESPAVPFDAARGEVLIACQRHFSEMPPDVVFEVSVVEAGVRSPRRPTSSRTSSSPRGSYGRAAISNERRRAAWS